ncbi:MAG: hypothetical protein J0H92_00530 [Sphingobacteriales bacterium]|nr:hypothetical protein [Sphingobacteriales bacterium]OJW35482.1 MAG: hypothetical protein BGO54_04015 [Sphingobacteriales bacterium 46-32]
MSENNFPRLSNKKIIRSVLFALGIAILVLVCAVLPAEYGIDPVGTGKLFGFNKLYIPEDTAQDKEGIVRKSYPPIKMEKAGSAPDVKRPVEADNPPPAKQFELREDSVQVVVPAGKGIEYKMYVLKYGNVKYEWTTDKDVLYFDFHGEVSQEQETKDVYYQSYAIAYSNNMVGTFISPFEGKHGWFFRNNGKEDVTVTIRLKGEYVL